MDAEKVQREMRLLAEERITRFVGEEQILLTKTTAAKVCNKSVPWIDATVPEAGCRRSGSAKES